MFDVATPNKLILTLVQRWCMLGWLSFPIYFSIYGMSQLGFPIYDGNKASRLSCIPDYVAAITQTERYGTSSMLKIYQTVLVIDVSFMIYNGVYYVFAIDELPP